MIIQEPSGRLPHADLHVVCHVARDGVGPWGLLEDRSGHAGVHRPVGHQPGNEPLPGNTATGAPDSRRGDRTGAGEKI